MSDKEYLTLGCGQYRITLDDGYSVDFTWIDDDHNTSSCGRCACVVMSSWETGDDTAAHVAWHRALSQATNGKL